MRRTCPARLSRRLISARDSKPSDYPFCRAIQHRRRIKKKAASFMKSGLFRCGSPGGTRTPDQLVTSAPAFLPGLDYLIIRSRGRRALSRFIGWGPQPLVSARSCLPDSPSTGFAQDYHRGNGIPPLGFPEFTRFFIPPLGGKLQLGVDLPMTVGAKQFALLKLRPNFFPTSGITSTGNPEVLFGRSKMMEF